MNNDKQNDSVILMQRWYTSAPSWQKYLYNQLVIDPNCNIETLASDVFKKIDEKETNFESEFITQGIAPLTSDTIQLNVITDIKGVNALSAGAKLDFTSGMNIIFGLNGSGKSSYVSLLKSIMNNRFKPSLRGNVFDDKQVTASALIKYQCNGNSINEIWTENQVSSIPSTPIFDSKSSINYTNNKNELIFEPNVLSIFTTISAISLLLKNKLEQNRKKISYVNIPQKIKNTVLINKFQNLQSLENTKFLKEKLTWSPNSDSKLNKLESSLSSSNPNNEINRLNIERTVLLDIYKSIVRIATEQLSIESIKKFYNHFSIAEMARKAADEDVAKVFSDSLIEGVGTDSWKILWESARSFSNQIAYKNFKYPGSDEATNCVLCHQPINEHTKHRLHNFETFIKSELQNNAKIKKEKFEFERKTIEKININDIKTKAESAHSFIEDKHYSMICNAINQLELLKSNVLKFTPEEVLPTTDDITLAVEKIIELGTQRKEHIATLENTIKNRSKIETCVNELQGEKWLYTNSLELTKKETELYYTKFIGETNTRNITSLKAKLSEVIVTEEYTKQFDFFIEQLSARSIKVEHSTSNIRGKIYTSIILKGSKNKSNPNEILSEGEMLIVSLASYMTEMSLANVNLPWILDDPASSLDQEYEERVSACLAEASKERQVIVFTHRIPLLSSIVKNVSEEPNLIALTKIPIGHPKGDLPVNSLKMTTEIERLRKKLKEAQTALEADEVVVYSISIQALQRAIRKMVENQIEKTLLSGIVMRYDRNISSMKLRYLNAITPSDINIFNNWMSKYSFGEHSQPDESPVIELSIEEIKLDLDEMHTWSKDFTKRTKQFS